MTGDGDNGDKSDVINADGDCNVDVTGDSAALRVDDGGDDGDADDE